MPIRPCLTKEIVIVLITCYLFGGQVFLMLLEHDYKGEAIRAIPDASNNDTHVKPTYDSLS